MTRTHFAEGQIVFPEGDTADRSSVKSVRAGALARRAMRTGGFRISHQLVAKTIARAAAAGGAS
jgi:hypothetical protein